VCRLDPAVLEALFGIQTAAPKKEQTKKPVASSAMAGQYAILDSRKAHNFSIQLRALGLTRREVCEALMEGTSSMFFNDAKLISIALHLILCNKVN
jgi:hypothetical protein